LFAIDESWVFVRGLGCVVGGFYKQKIFGPGEGRSQGGTRILNLGAELKKKGKKKKKKKSEGVKS
jgi:hypothetical protein